MIPSVSEGLSSRVAGDYKIGCAKSPTAIRNQSSSCLDVLTSPDTLSAPDDTYPNNNSLVLDSQFNAPSPSVRIKRGYREMSTTMTCGVVSESDPVWMWSLRPNSWQKIFVLPSELSFIRSKHPELLNVMAKVLVQIPSTFAGDYPMICPDVMFISGSRRFIMSLVLPTISMHVIWLSDSPRRPPTDFHDIQWTRVSHCKVGGVTEARGTLGISASFPKISLDPDVKRSLGHILKFSIRPKACDPETSLVHYMTSDLLSLSLPRRPILYSTYMSRTGWGIRELSDDELSLCFELPSYVMWEDRFLKCILPLQLFRSVIDCVTGHLEVTPAPLKRHTASQDEVVSFPEIDACWLPSISKWLPGSWSLTEIASKAVKADNAPVDFTPWHRRIQLVLPCSDDTIAVLERFAARIWRRNVCQSLFIFLRREYGKDWHMSGIQHIGAHESDSVPPPPKRSKLSDVSVASRPEKGGGTAGPNSTTISLPASRVGVGCQKGFTPRWSDHSVNLVGMDARVVSILLAVERSRTAASSSRRDAYFCSVVFLSVSSTGQIASF